MDFLKTKALGRSADLGSLYDVRTENFIPGIKIFKQNIPDSLIETTDAFRTDWDIIYEDSISSKYTKLDISGELKLSAMIEIIDLELKGSGKYLSEEKTSSKSVRATITYKSQTKNQSISLSDSKFKKIASAEIFKNSNIGTHVVVGIEWGANVYITFEHKNSENKDKSEITGSFNAGLKILKIPGLGIKGRTNVDFNKNRETNSDEFNIKVIADLSFDVMPQSWNDVANIISELPKLIKANGGKGVPLEFSLMPLNEAMKCFNFSIKLDIILKRLQEDTIKRVEHELSDLLEKKQKLNDLFDEIDEQYFNKKELDELKNMKRNIDLCEIDFKRDLKTAIISIRSGKKDTKHLDMVLEKFIKEKKFSICNECFLEENLFLKRKNQIETEFKHNGFIFMKKKDSLADLQAKKTRVFVLIFSDSMIEADKEKWNSYHQFLLDLSKDELEKKSEFYLYNTDIHNDDFKSICIYFYEDDRLKEKDFYNAKAHLITKALARSTALDYSLEKPADCCSIFLRCPNRKERCPNVKLNWTCEKCNNNFQYGHDSRIYCECGGAHFETFKFKCPDINHPLNGFIEYGMTEILQELGIKVSLINDKNEKYEGEIQNNKKQGKGTMNFANGDKYEGDWKDDKMNGKGTVYYSDGNKYEGDWKDDKRDGKGVLNYARGEKYEGDWKDSIRDGKGTMKFADGNKYEGDWKDDKINGEGTTNYANGCKYEGDWKNGLKDGKGTMNYADGNKYKGDWKNDKIYGKGTYNYSNGSKYEGDWKNGKRDGKGTMNYADGNKYEGDWKDGIRDGKGTMNFADGNKYEGDWKYNEMNGKGTYYYASGSKYEGDWKSNEKNGKGIYNFASGDKYEGDWKDSKMNGKGTYNYANGSKYEGDWKSNEKNGRGTYYYASGSKYEGDWKDSKMNGKGTMNFADGNKYEGDWKDDKINGKGTTNYANGCKYEGEWKDGKIYGKGTMHLASGEIYEGDWKDEKNISKLFSLLFLRSSH